MTDLYVAVRKLAASQLDLVTRPQFLELGGSDRAINTNLHTGRWCAPQPGVFDVSAQPPTWHRQLLAACLAAGPLARGSSRAGARLWGLGYDRSESLEITSVHSANPDPRGAIVHRSRRHLLDEPVIRHGVPVDPVERVLLSIAARGGAKETERCLEAALRLGHTTDKKLETWLDTRGGRGVTGTRLLRATLHQRAGQAVTGSDGEVAVLQLLRDGGIPEPVRQHVIPLRHGGFAKLDFAWPWRPAAIEFNGWLGHASTKERYFDGLSREEDIRETGYRLRVLDPTDIHARPGHVVAVARRLLEPAA